MGADQNGISDRGKEREVEEPSKRGESRTVSDGLSGEVRGEIRENIRANDGESRSDGETESRGFVGLDSEGTTSENGSDKDNNSGNQRNDVKIENTEENSVQFGHIDEGENVSNSKNQEEITPTYIIQDVYSDFNDDGELENYFIAYNSIEVGEKITELTGNGTFLEFEAIAQKYSGHFQESPDDNIPAHFSFKNEEDREAFAAEANVIINNILNPELTQNQQEEIQNENTAENSEEKSVQFGHIEEENIPTREDTANGKILGTVEERTENFTLTFTVEEQRYDNYGDVYYNAFPSKKVLRVANFKFLEEIAQKYSGSLYDDNYLSFNSKNDRNAFIEEVNKLVKSKEVDLSSIDYNADMSTTSGKRAVFKRNIAAIRLIKELEDDNRDATPEEAKLLQSYAGFGGIPEAFDSFNKSWSEEYNILLSELSTTEFEEARNSTLNAHYTPDNIVQSIYEGLSSLGFENGYILDKRVACLIQTNEKETAVKVLEIKPFTAVFVYGVLI